ncbi:MAG: type II toxin-antitoxin system RelE/ParE family toxin [Endomicrobia bacterium]|nr:type II toxin-antitoxin system RelE/ParE family toxin [Bacillota bacterium]MCL1971830.1 type II toxin-antitoxin system RelE/ParE family toxin [Endomicrobiia bacterium]
MIIKRTFVFEKWFSKQKNNIKEIIVIYLNRVVLGNMSNCKSLGGGLHELKIHYGKGIRVYFTNINGEIIILLCAGDKSSQQEDIIKAKVLKENL